MTMAENCREEEDRATVAIANPNHSFGRRPLEIKRAKDSISSLPDDILLIIFSYIPTKFAIRTSVLSKRWRHLWSDTPSLSFDWTKAIPKSINKTLASYSPAKITSFHFCTCLAGRAHHVNSWIEFAMSHNVERLAMEFRGLTRDYSFPDLFYSNSSLKQLIVDSGSNHMIPKCTVSWTSLRSLYLSCCSLSDESFPKILSGCPMLESLGLQFCDSLEYLDLSKSLRLTRLDIDCCPSARGPVRIVAPHIHYLRLRYSEAPCSLVDVSSLTEADLNICHQSCKVDPLKAHYLQVMVQSMLEKLHHVEKLTLGVNFIQILSVSELHGVTFPTFKVKTLTLETKLLQSVVPGIARLLQSSPELNKITVYTTKSSTTLEGWVNSYLGLQELNLDQWWRSEVVAFPTNEFDSKVVDPQLVASLIQLLLANTTTLEVLVVHQRSEFGKLFEMARAQVKRC